MQLSTFTSEALSQEYARAIDAYCKIAQAHLYLGTNDRLERLNKL